LQSKRFGDSFITCSTKEVGGNMSLTSVCNDV